MEGEKEAGTGLRETAVRNIFGLRLIRLTEAAIFGLPVNLWKNRETLFKVFYKISSTQINVYKSASIVIAIQRL